MLKFNKLRLSGFKSFVDNTELPIELGLTGVVGPNGCGKSNLVEALRWVMGETSAKQMRGAGMEDVIFGGTANRPPRNIAEVSLVLGNDERSAPAQFNDVEELEVSRRIEREKGSLYRVNGSDVRARDVQLLFADSATGARSTALVSQGRIGAIINAKPTERRGLLEEAAGITGLHSRRHEAELRLRGAETNLERLDDILVTLDTQLQGLKKQARQATRYRNLSEHIRKAQATLLHMLWKQAQERLAEAEARLRTVDAEVGELTGHAAHAAKLQAERAETIPALRQAEAEAAAELHRLTVARENLEAEAERIRLAAEDATRRLEQLDADKLREQALAADALAATERLGAERTEIEAARESEAEAREAAEAELRDADAAVAEIENRLAELTERVATIDAKRAGLGQRIAEITQRRDRLTLRAGEIADQLQRLAAENPDAGELAEAEAALGVHQVNLMDRRDALNKAEAAKATTEDASRAAVSELHAAQARVTELEAEERVIEKVLATVENDLFPPVIDALQVTPGFEAALGAALGDDLSSPTDEASAMHWRTLPPMLGAPTLPAGSRPLADVVQAPAALARRLSQIGVVESDAEARALAGDLKQGQRLVSREGGLWRWDGFTVSSAAPTPAATRLEQRNRLAELRGQLSGRRAEQATAEAARDAARDAEGQARDAERQARQAVGEAETALDAIRERLAAIKERVAQHNSKLAALEEARTGNTNDLTEAETALAAAEQELAATPAPETERRDIETGRTELAERRTHQVECRTRRDGLERQARARGERLLAIAGELQSWERREAESRRQLEQLDERRAVLAEELEGLKAQPAAIEEKRTALLEALTKSEQRRSVAADALQTAENGLREADGLLREAEAALGKARENRVRAEGAVEQGNQALASVAERAADKLSCPPEQLFDIAGLEVDKPLPELDATERKVERLVRERETMGPVNLRAEVEAEELQAQIDTLGTERDDLIAAIDKLRQGISELNREGRARLLASFKEVDKHFQDLFVRLFGGGRAHLALTESDDPLDAGLEIMASPPGKMLQVLSLLSGGEQALTALSLLFAVFLTNPAPICVLDEVDAPLDDANVDRFCKLLEEMSANNRTRFLVITHHRMTMARMHRLFGVTMAERGVSQLVSVDLQRAEELRDIA
ncbi:MAG: chromosome segregation protein SMC [Rhodospirillaceae bacterium]